MGWPRVSKLFGSSASGAATVAYGPFRLERSCFANHRESERNIAGRHRVRPCPAVAGDLGRGVLGGGGDGRLGAGLAAAAGYGGVDRVGRRGRGGAGARDGRVDLYRVAAAAGPAGRLGDPAAVRALGRGAAELRPALAAGGGGARGGALALPGDPDGGFGCIFGAGALGFCGVGAGISIFGLTLGAAAEPGRIIRFFFFSTTTAVRAVVRRGDPVRLPPSVSGLRPPGFLSLLSVISLSFEAGPVHNAGGPSRTGFTEIACESPRKLQGFVKILNHQRAEIRERLCDANFGIEIVADILFIFDGCF